jgi:hypothetical protein
MTISPVVTVVSAGLIGLGIAVGLITPWYIDRIEALEAADNKIAAAKIADERQREINTRVALLRKRLEAERRLKFEKHVESAELAHKSERENLRVAAITYFEALMDIRKIYGHQAGQNKSRLKNHRGRAELSGRYLSAVRKLQKAPAAVMGNYFKSQLIQSNPSIGNYISPPDARHAPAHRAIVVDFIADHYLVRMRERDFTREKAKNCWIKPRGAGANLTTYPADQPGQILIWPYFPQLRGLVSPLFAKR